MVANRDNLTINTVQGDLADLSELKSASFDYIIHPISNLYVSDLSAVWQECYRVLCQQGVLLASFYNPVIFIFDRNIPFEQDGLIKPKYSLPYSDLLYLEKDVLDEKIKNNEAIVFGFYLFYFMTWLPNYFSSTYHINLNSIGIYSIPTLGNCGDYDVDCWRCYR